MSKLHFLFLYIIFQCQLSLSAQMEFKQWRKELKLQMVENLCAPHTYFKSCFEVSEKECKTMIARSFENCFSTKHKSPFIDPQGDGQKLAYNNGVCLGEQTEKKWKDKKSNEKKVCHRLDRWL